MTKTTGGLLALAALILVGCPKAPEPKQLPPPPSIKSFTADKVRIEPRESVTLTFEAENATEALIVDGAGKELAFEGDAHGGSVTFTPEHTDVYLLKVVGEGGRATDYTRVAVGEDLTDVFLAAVPPHVKAGEPVDLVWSAQHAQSAQITSSGDAQVPAVDPASGGGVITVTPARSQTFTLTASGAAADSTLSAEAPVVVDADVDAFTATPLGAPIGETITLHWTTRGADEVTLSESLFGELKRVSVSTESAEVNDGSFDFVVPETLPSGVQLTEGQPLHFVLTVKQSEPDVTLTRTLTAYVGTTPVIDAFVAPDAMTEGKTISVSWKTGNASKVQLFSNGLMVFETLPREQARAANGGFVLPAIGRDLDLKLVAINAAGGSTEMTHTVALVKAPKILTFELPGQIGAAGDSATATWTTANASAVIIRSPSGPTLFQTSDPAKVASGNAEVYPASTTATFVLEAFNAAGEKVTAEQTVRVNSPEDVSVAPTPALAGTPVTLTWNLDTAKTAEVLGIPSATPIQDSTAIDWLELDGHVQAEELTFSSANDGIARIPLAIPFRFPLVDGVREEVWVSTNGFVSFDNVGALAENEDLTEAGTPEVIAPFWDDLDLTDGKVLYLVDDSVTPRRLVIEWSNAHTASDPLSALTFQVQLEETGRFRFLYQTLTGTGSAGENATIGVKVRGDLFHAQTAFDSNSAVVGPDSELTWFGAGQLSGTMQFTLGQSAYLGFFTRQQGGHFLFHPAPVSVFAPGSILISEAMPLPDVAAPSGQWVEIYNAQSVPVNLEGLELSTTGGAPPYPIPSVTIPARSYYVFGQSLVPEEAGGAHVDEVWTGLTLAAADSVQIGLQGTPLSTLSWTLAMQNESVQPPEPTMDSSGQPITCTRSMTFGVSSIGTPAAPNESCFDYTLTPVGSTFEDISLTGTPVFSPGSNQDSVYDQIDLSSHPFTYFGTPGTSLYVSSNGWLGFGTATSSYTGNKTKPSTSNPTATISPFWDDLEEGNSTDSGVYYQYLPPSSGQGGRWIIQWHHFARYDYPASGDDLNFEVKLFDDGAIEFHYAAMTSGTADNYGNGNSATVWIERPAGDAAMVIGVNQPVIQSDTAYRFTPNPKAP